jgi:hypothetical protein
LASRAKVSEVVLPSSTIFAPGLNNGVWLIARKQILAAFLALRWAAPITITRQIAEGAKGNVRAAMADLEMWMG